MTNQEIVQALKEYMHLDSQLSQLLQEKQKLEKEIDYYKTPKEKPEPERPSKIAEFVPIFCCSSGIVVFVCGRVRYDVSWRNNRTCCTMLCCDLDCYNIFCRQKKKLRGVREVCIRRDGV